MKKVNISWKLGKSDCLFFLLLKVKNLLTHLICFRIMFSFIMKHYLILIFRSSKLQNVFQDPQKIASFPILKKIKNV